MIFSKKEKITKEYVVEQCETCKNHSKRKFIVGDYLFKETSSCITCKNPMKIIKIFGEVIEP